MADVNKLGDGLARAWNRMKTSRVEKRNAIISIVSRDNLIINDNRRI